MMKEILDEHLLKDEVPKNKWFYFCLAVLLLGSVISSSIAWYDVESIIGSGPIMSVVGCIVSIYAFNIKIRSLVWLGLIPLAISIFWWFSIETFNLSPRDCKINIPTSLTFATVLVSVFGINYLLGRKSAKF